METLNSFDPVLYSTEENNFLLTHLGQPPIVALKEITRDVNQAAVKPILERVYELEQLQKHDGEKWVGVERLKESIKVYLEQDAKWERDYIRTGKRAPRFPSLYSYDAKGRPHKGGPGSDSGHVRSYFDSNGQRIMFEVPLVDEGFQTWTAPGFTEVDITEKGLKIDKVTNRIECLIKVGEGTCGHTESFKADSRASFNAARARMSKHLRKATENVEEHRELHTNEYGS